MTFSTNFAIKSMKYTKNLKIASRRGENTRSIKSTATSNKSIHATDSIVIPFIFII